MPIFDRQLKKRTEELTLDALREGRVPSLRELSSKLREFVKRTESGPLMRPRYQGYRQVWDIEATNQVKREILFDLEVAYEEVIDQYAKMLRRQGFIDLAYRSQKQEVERLIGMLRNLLFVTKNAEDNFYGVFDSFTDLTKTNQTLTSQDAVDLEEGVVHLPQTSLTGGRVDMSWLYPYGSWPTTAVSLAPAPAEGQDGPQVVQNESVPGAGFGNAWGDFATAWRHVVTTGDDHGVELVFTVPVSRTTNETLTLTRIAITSGAAQEMQVKLLHSMDDVNYTRFAGVEEFVSVGAGKTRAVDFEDTRVRFVRFVCRMTTPTVLEGESRGYVYAFKRITLHRLGRVQQSEFFSKPLSPTGLTNGIDKVSLQVIEEIPAGCSVDYFVAADDGAGQPDGGWRPIAPMNRSTTSGLPRLVRFGYAADVVTSLPAPTPALPYDTVRQVDFYRLTEDPLTYNPIFSSALLYRGRRAWWRNTNRTAEIREIRDAYIDFGPGDTQFLYALATETPDVERELRTTTSTPQTVLKTTRDVHYDATSGMLLKPPPATNPEMDQRPNYAVYKVLRYRDTMVVDSESVVMANDETWVSMANTGVQSRGTGRPVVKDVTSSVTYIEGSDYVLEVDPDSPEHSPVLTGRIRRISTGNISGGATVKISYTLNSDVTYLVDAARGNRIFLSKDLGVATDQYFQVTYRFIPRTPDNTIRKATLEVRSNYGSQSGGTIYKEGPDFIVDPNQGTITRVPTGAIQMGTGVYVDFQYEEQPQDLDTFTTWVRVDSRDPIRVEFNPIGADLDAGEMILVDGTDVSRMTEFPELSFGWHQIVVRSKRPEANGNAAIVRMAELRDRINDPIFVSGGKYFAEMTASRVPMGQRTYTQLTKNTARGDHGWFAITDDGHVVVNFEPGTTEEIYTYGLRRAVSTDTYSAQTWPEEFELTYSYALAEQENVTAVLLKASLRRGPDAPQGVTPKIHEYHLRIG